MHTYRYAILGGGVVAGYAAQELAQLGLRSGELCIISADETLPYERAALSKDYMTGNATEEAILINSEEFYSAHGIDVRLNARVEIVDFENRMLRATSREEISFDKLLIATGTRSRTLDLPGGNRAGMYYMRNLDDARAMRALAGSTERAVVVGGGYIAVETAASLRQDGLEVTLVVPEAHVMQDRFNGDSVSEFFEAELERRGVQVARHMPVASFGANGQVTGVISQEGHFFPGDFVVVDAGVTPNTELFENTGLQLDDGVVTNEYLEASIKNVLAAGDVANYYDTLFQRQRRVEQWDDAAAQARHAARVMTNRREPFTKVPYFFSQVFDRTWEFWGDSQGATYTVQRGSLEDGSFSWWWLRNGVLVAALVTDRPDEEREFASQWIQSQEKVPLELLERDDLSLSEPYPDPDAARRRD
jgi:NADPH-dependent 2,4-dienoyl-CoA reductase/sulfur reductase-like enzyme